MSSANKHVAKFLASVPEDRRQTAQAVRDLIVNALPAGYEEELRGKMLCYEVPVERYSGLPRSQPLMYAALALRKTGFTLHLMTAERRGREWLSQQFADAGKKLDLGKACFHFDSMDDLPVKVVSDLIAASPVDDYVAWFEAGRGKS